MKTNSRQLTPAEIAEIRATLSHARKGRATLKELASAHELASDQGSDLHFVVGELREHLRRNTPGPMIRSEVKSVILGIVSGILTWTILGRRDETSSPKAKTKRNVGWHHHLADR